MGTSWIEVPPVVSPVIGPVNAGKCEKDKHKESGVSNKNTNSSIVDSKGFKKNGNDIDNNKNQPDGARRKVSWTIKGRERWTMP